MTRVIRWILDNPVMMNLVFVLVVGAGLLAWRDLPKEEFPQVATDRLVVVGIWPGASPPDVEEQLVRPIEDALDGVSGVRHAYAEAQAGRALLTVELVRGTDVDEARQEVERALQGISGLPEDTRPLQVRRARLTIPIIHVALTGDVRQRERAEVLADALAAFPGVSEVEILGAAERRVELVLDPAALAARGLSAADVARVVEASGHGVPAGDVEGDGLRVAVRTPRGVEGPEALAALPLVVNGGSALRLGDLGRVEESWGQPEVREFVGGQPAIVLRVLRQEGADSLVTVDAVRAWAAEQVVPEGLGLLAYDDSARMVRHRIRILAGNGFAGAVLVMAVLVAFVGVRNALMVLWGMPVAWFGALIAIQASGNSLNVISSFALLLVTGIIVDDAVIIVENVQRHLEQGSDRVRAAIEGSVEVMPAVFASTLTTCLAFAPLMMLEGTVGRVLSIVPEVVIYSLVASLFEAFFVLPGHLGHHAAERVGLGETLATRWLKRVYEPLVVRITLPGWRYAALGGLVLGLVAVMGLAASLRTTLTTPGSPTFALVNLDLPESASAEATRAAVARVETAVKEQGEGMVIYLASRVGLQQAQQDLPTRGPNRGQLKIGFENRPEVLERVPALLDSLRAGIEADPRVVSSGIETVEGGPPSGRPIDVRVRSVVPEDAERVAEGLRAFLMGRAGVSDVRTDAARAEELRVRVDPVAAARLGLQEVTVGLAVRAALDGTVAVELPVRERTTEVRVRVDGSQAAERLLDLPLAIGGGRTVRLRQVATLDRTASPGRVERVDGQRAVRISAQIDKSLTTSELEKAAIEAWFAEAAPAGTSLFYGGQLADTAESFAELPAAFALAMAMIYAVLAVQFRSYVQPLVILAAVPLGLAGVVLGLASLGMDLSFIAAIGAVGLVGIVVNDSLVLVDFVNKASASGLPLREAVIDASLTRLRPILVTTVTTVLGLLPLALGLAGEEPLLAPMAVSISFGLSFATALTLIAVPVLVLVLDDLASLPGRLRR